MFSVVNKSLSSSSILGTRLTRTLTQMHYITTTSTELNLSSSSPSIHPTAIVHPGALIGEDVSIGPFCTVGSNAKIGSGAIVGEDLPGSTVIGCNNLIGHHAVVGARCQDLKYKAGDECFLNIGDNNDIREFTSIHRSSNSSDITVIGDNNLLMGSCHIAHDCKVGHNNIFANSTLFAGHVVVEDSAHTAGAIVVHQFCQIGSFAFIGGGSVIAQDVPKYMMVSGDRAQLCGLNLEGLRRHGFSSEEVRSMRKAYRKIFMSVDAKSGGIEDRLSEVEQSSELANFQVVHSMVQSIRDSFEQNRRGICKSRFWGD